MQTKIYSQLGESTNKITLPKDIFEVEINPVLTWQVLRGLKLRLKKPSAFSKTRSEVSGGGAKPWRQKGTGRARAGSIRSPLFVGGGVAFGPRQTKKTYLKKINKKMKRLALLGVLTWFAKNDKIIILKELQSSINKTRQAAKILENLPTSGTVLLILTREEMPLKRAFRNLPYVTTIDCQNLNIVYFEGIDYLVITRGGIENIHKTFGSAVKDEK